ncbi:MAG: hypothetical protein CMJ78_20745 [Planctomycetaceae bacterium]|nr:hypothetical protein [Planctomycetaceae bacterium]
MDNWIAAIAVGVILLVIGGGMMYSHTQSWRRHKNDGSLDDFDRKHYYKRYRRRMQTSGLITLLGILIPIGDAPFVWGQRDEVLSSAYWLGVLILLMWIIVMALGDMTSSRLHGNVAMARIRQKQRELEAQVAELKRHEGNGRHKK